MPSCTIALEQQQAYPKLKESVIKNSTVIIDNPPAQLTVRHGSLWGITPKTAKKIVNFVFQPEGNQTKVSFTSRLTRDWTMITLIGCFLSALLTGICIWMALDLSAFLANGNPSFWGWIVVARGQVQFSTGEAFVNLALGLSIFLLVIIVLEIAVFLNCYSKIQKYAEEIINDIA